MRSKYDADGTALESARTLYEVSMFVKNRGIVAEADGLRVVADLLRSRDDEVVDYACRIAASFALDGPETVATLRDLGVHKLALGLATSSNPIVQSEAVNLLYWLAQDPESKQFLLDQNINTVIADAQVTAKDLTVARFLSHASNAVLPSTKSAGELANLVEQSSLTSSIRSARAALLSGAGAQVGEPSLSNPLRSAGPAEDHKAVEAYYAPKSGQEEAEDKQFGSVSAPKAEKPSVPEDVLEIDQVRLTFTLNIGNRRRLKKVLLSGNLQELGMWAPKKAPAMVQNARGEYQFELVLPSWRKEFEYKYAVVETLETDKDPKNPGKGKVTHDDFKWESGFIRKCKLDNSRLQKVDDNWESAEGLEDYAPASDEARPRSVTEQVPKSQSSKIAEEDKRPRSSSSQSNSGKQGWRKQQNKLYGK